MVSEKEVRFWLWSLWWYRQGRIASFCSKIVGQWKSSS